MQKDPYFDTFIKIPQVFFGNKISGIWGIGFLKLDVEGFDHELIQDYVAYLWQRPECILAFGLTRSVAQKPTGLGSQVEIGYQTYIHRNKIGWDQTEPSVCSGFDPLFVIALYEVFVFFMFAQIDLEEDQAERKIMSQSRVLGKVAFYSIVSLRQCMWMYACIYCTD